MTLLPWLKHSVGIITTITPLLRQHLSHAKYCLNPFIPHSNRAVTWEKSRERGQVVRTTQEGGEGWRWEYVDMQWGEAKAAKKANSSKKANSFCSLPKTLSQRTLHSEVQVGPTCQRCKSSLLCQVRL